MRLSYVLFPSKPSRGYRAPFERSRKFVARLSPTPDAVRAAAAAAAAGKRERYWSYEADVMAVHVSEARDSALHGRAVASCFKYHGRTVASCFMYKTRRHRVLRGGVLLYI